MTARGAALARGEIRAAPTDPVEARQRRRVLWWLLAAMAVALCIDVVARPADADPALHTSMNSGASGFRAFHALLGELGYDVDRHRATYGRLPDPATSVLLRLAPLDDLESVGASGHTATAQGRLLRAWLEEGGHLVTTTAARASLRVREFVLRPRLGEAALDDDVLDEALGGDVPDTHFTAFAETAAGKADLAGLRVALPSLDAHGQGLLAAYVAGGGRVRTLDRDLADDWTVDLVLGEVPFAAVRRIGRGRVWFVASPMPFATAAIGRNGTGALAVALAHAASEGGQRKLWLDEYCHGLGLRRSGWWWVLHGDLLYPFVSVLACALLLGWRGAVRFGVPDTTPSVPRRGVEEYVISLADLSRRAGQHRAAAAAIAATWTLRRREQAAEPELRAITDAIAAAEVVDADGLARFDVAAERAGRRAPREPTP